MANGLGMQTFKRRTLVEAIRIPIVSPGEIVPQSLNQINIQIPELLYRKPNELVFNMAIERHGVPGVNSPGNSLALPRDWNGAFRNPTDGFAAVRWCPSWVRTDNDPADWQPASVDIYRIQRKASSGAGLRVLVFTTSPHTVAIPAGDNVVVWDADSDVSVAPATTHALSGFSLPLKQKLVVTACTPSQHLDLAGRRLIEVSFNQDLPAIDFSPSFFSGVNGVQKSAMQLRHWSFYANASTKELRNPIKNFANITINEILPNDGRVILGGNRWPQTNYDWSKEYLNFGASLTEDLFRLECQGLANTFGTTDPRYLAVELENAVFHQWETVETVVGYRALLGDVWYPIAREAWGQDRTLIVKGPGSVNTFLSTFDWPCPLHQNVQVGLHAISGAITGPDGRPINFNNINDSDWLSKVIGNKISSLGYKGGGLVSLIVPAPIDTVSKAKKLGRVLTSMSNANLYTFFNTAMGNDPATTINVSNIFSINGMNIEALYPEMRQYARRAGLTIK